MCPIPQSASEDYLQLDLMLVERPLFAGKDCDPWCSKVSRGVEVKQSKDRSRCLDEIALDG